MAHKLLVTKVLRHSLFLLGVILFIFLVALANRMFAPTSLEPNQLLMDSEREVRLGLSSLYVAKAPDPRVIKQAAKNVDIYSDYRGFHSLCYLHQFATNRFEKIPQERIASILLSTLAKYDDLIDFGILDDSPYFGPAGEILIQCKAVSVIVPALTDLLADTHRVRLGGSKTASMSHSFDYRTKDYAYVFLCKFLNIAYVFHAKPAVRDCIIDDNMLVIRTRADALLRQ
jgi:hypothetical protein